MSARIFSDCIGQGCQKKKSRDAARSRRGQQNDEFLELASQLPISIKEAGQLDRLSIMRLTNSYVKMKHILSQFTSAQDFQRRPFLKAEPQCDPVENLLSEALDGFVFVVGSDGRCLYVSDSISRYLGLLPIEMTGSSFYKYIHPCDHEEVAKELCGEIPLEDMEIFDGLFCSDSVFIMSNNLKGGSKDRHDVTKQPFRSFFVRMKSTLTSRGKSVNLKASTYRVVHCLGCLKSVSDGSMRDEKGSPICFVGIGVPLMFTSTFEVPLDQCTFSSHHDLDLSFVYSENSIEEILGYKPSEILGKSMYKFLHGCDQDVLTTCHKTLLTKGQCVSGYYRLLAKNGGWVWVQTKASIVYATRTCQPQFVLCVHYAISGIEQEDMPVSLDQVRGLRERRKSPRNSPADPAKYYNQDQKKRLPVIQTCPENSSLQFQTTSDTPTEAADNDCLEMPLDMDLTGVSLDNERPEICEVHTPETEQYFESIDSEQMESSEYLNSPSIPPPAHDSTLLSEPNVEQCAPFIPPPFGDTQFSVDEKELEMFDVDNPFCCEDLSWTNDAWEIANDFEKYFEKNLPQKGFLKRNLSTPTFFPLAEKVNPEP